MAIAAPITATLMTIILGDYGLNRPSPDAFYGADLD